MLPTVLPARRRLLQPCQACPDASSRGAGDLPARESEGRGEEGTGVSGATSPAEAAGQETAAETSLRLLAAAAAASQQLGEESPR